MIEITKDEAVALIDLIELNIFDIIRNDENIDGVDWLCNIMAIYKKCKTGEATMKNNPANVVKDTMWHFLIDGGQIANAKALKEAVYDLIGMTTQKNAGQRKAKKDIDWDNLDMIMMTIVIEATALVLSGELDKEEEI